MARGHASESAWRWCKRRGLGHLCITANTFAYPTAVEDASPEASAVAVLPQPLQTAMPVWMAAFGNVSVKRAARLGYPLLPAALESIPELQAKYQLYHATWVQESARRLPWRCH